MAYIPNSTSSVDPPSVLVLLAAYNGAAWIAEQLQSILDQTSVSVTVVVRDDGSVDSSLAEVERFIADGRVTIVRASRPTGSAAQNFFALIHEHPAKEFDFVAFSDQDDFWYPEKLSRACHSLAAGEYAGYSSATLAAWEDGRTVVMRQCSVITPADFLFEGAGQGCTFVLCNSFYQRVRAFMLEHPQLLSELHYHDWAIYALARSWRLQWHFDSKPTMRYRQHRGNDTGARGSWTGVGRRLSLIANGWYAGQIRVVTRLCHAADPADRTIGAWTQLLEEPGTFGRRLRVAIYCGKNGRRKASDRTVLVLAALAGWI